MIADYAESAGATRETIVTYNHVQRGDPTKAATAIVDVTEVDEPPLRLQLGADSIERIEAKLDLVQRELAQWRSVALSTDHAECSDHVR